MTRILLSSLILAFCTLTLPANAGETYPATIEAAREQALAQHPAAALAAYRTALTQAGDDPARVRVALFGIGRMLLSLERYEDARNVYAELLASTLDRVDRDVALDGEIQSLSYLDRPHSAYAFVPRDRTIDNGALVISAARAASWSGRPDLARSILERNAPALTSLDPHSRLASQLASIAEAVHREIEPRVALSQSSTHDSDGLLVNEAMLELRRSLTRADALTLEGRAVSLSGSGAPIVGSSILVGYAGRVSDDLTFAAKVGSRQFAGWNHGIALAEIAYAPSDALRIVASTDSTVVESLQAISNRITTSTDGITVRLIPLARFVATAGLSTQMFSDGNRRAARSGSVSYAVLPDIGLGVQARVRSFSDRLSPNDGYFSPARLDEEQLLFTENRRVRTWRYSAVFGIGRQRIVGSRTATTTLGLSAGGPLGGCLRTEASISNANSALASISGYRSTNVTIQFACTL